MAGVDTSALVHAGLAGSRLVGITGCRYVSFPAEASVSYARIRYRKLVEWANAKP